MIQKNLEEETNKLEDHMHKEVIDNANALTMDCDDDTQIVSEGKDTTCEVKKIKVYKRKEKVAPKVVRRSARLNKKGK